MDARGEGRGERRDRLSSALDETPLISVVEGEGEGGKWGHMCYTTDPGQVHLDLGLCLGLQHLDNGTHMLPHVVLCRITYTTPSW